MHIKIASRFFTPLSFSRSSIIASVLAAFGALQEHHIVRNDAGRQPRFALLVGDLAVRDLAGDERTLALAQIRHDGVAQRRLEDDDAMPVGALRPVAVLVAIVVVRGHREGDDRMRVAAALLRLDADAAQQRDGVDGCVGVSKYCTQPMQ